MIRLGLAIVTLAALIGTQQPAAAPTITTIAGFDGVGCPSGPLHRDSNGNLYATLSCGQSQFGTYGAVVQLTPPTAGNTQWNQNYLAVFDNGQNGGTPQGGVIPDGHGGYWGTAYTGGKGWGTVFDLRPPNLPFNKNWRIATRWKFRPSKDGHSPTAGLAAGPDGIVFGTTIYGGNGGTTSFGTGKGTVFEIGPPRTTAIMDTETIIWKFTGGTDGSNPLAPPISDGAGGLYGTTTAGGAHGGGTVWHLTPPKTGTVWTMTVLYNFVGDLTDGTSPEGALLLNGGNLYGVCEGGSGILGQHGSVWKLIAPATVGGAWTFQKMWQYDGGTDGAEPMAGITRYKDTFYSTATYGGVGPGAAYGTLISLNRTGLTSWKENTVVTFNQGNGAYPSGPLLPDPANPGTFFGTTSGGILGYGQVFQFTP
jgi:hypothetical protein